MATDPTIRPVFPPLPSALRTLDDPDPVARRAGLDELGQGTRDIGVEGVAPPLLLSINDPVHMDHLPDVAGSQVVSD